MRARETSCSSSRLLLAALLAGVVVLDESHTTDRFNYSDIKSSCLLPLDSRMEIFNLPARHATS